MADEEDDEEDDPRYDSQGVLVGIDKLKNEVEFKTIQLEGGASYKVPSLWKVRRRSCVGRLYRFQLPFELASSFPTRPV